MVHRAELTAAAAPANPLAVFEQAAPACLLLRPDVPRLSLEAASTSFLDATGIALERARGSSASEVLATDRLALADPSRRALLETLVRAATAGVSARLPLAASEASRGTAPSSGVTGAPGGVRFGEASITPLLGEAGVHLIVLELRPQLEPEPDSQRRGPALALETPAARLARHARELELTRLELSNAQAELASFGYSVSHDLRAPLRAIDGFAQALAQDCGEMLDEQGKHYLERVHAGARRMSSLLDDLLELSRVQLAPLERMHVDVSDVARRVAASLASQQPERPLTIEVEDGLEAWADPRLFQQLLTVLLDNACKFTRLKPRPTVRVGRDASSDVPSLFVADDGAGFDMTYAQRLFSPFQRLHRAADYPGNGIGLAIARRIVARHGGRIWAHAKPGEGACFGFCFEGLSSHG